METLESEAAYHRLALRIGVITRKEVVDWACRQAEQLDSPSTELLKLTGMSESHPLDVFKTLTSLSEAVDQFQVMPRVLRAAHSKLVADPSTGAVVAGALHEIFVESNYYVPEPFTEMAYLSDNFGLEKEGILASGEALELLLCFTKRFVDA